MEKAILEIERRFLVLNLPEKLHHSPAVHLEQGYYTSQKSSELVRLRREKTRFLKTIKTGSGLQRTELEVEISEAEFLRLWPLTRGYRLRKTRYCLDWRGKTIELDLYFDHLEGFRVAEVEFQSVEESAHFEAPDWFGPEVTELENFTNAWFARHGVPEQYADLLRQVG